MTSVFIKPQLAVCSHSNFELHTIRNNCAFFKSDDHHFLYLQARTSHQNSYQNITILWAVDKFFAVFLCWRKVVLDLLQIWRAPFLCQGKASYFLEPQASGLGE